MDPTRPSPATTPAFSVISNCWQCLCVTPNLKMKFKTPIRKTKTGNYLLHKHPMVFTIASSVGERKITSQHIQSICILEESGRPILSERSNPLLERHHVSDVVPAFDGPNSRGHCRHDNIQTLGALL